MTPTPPVSGTIAVDARMIAHSGIGVMLQGLLNAWALAPPAEKMELLGDPALLEKHLPPALKANIKTWKAPIYSPQAALLPPPVSHDVVALYSPHYATSLVARVPLVCHVQDLIHITHPTRFGTALYLRCYLAALRRRASFIVTTTRHVKVQLQTLHGFQADKVLLSGAGVGNVANGFNADTPDKSASLPPPRSYFLAVGIYKPHKNWHFLLERFRGLTDTGKTLVCGGLGEEGRLNILRIARELGIEDRVNVIGRLPHTEFRLLFKHAEALLFPSLAEGFGLPIVEAMAAGLPVVVANRSPMKEIIGDAGYFFDPDWPSSFDDAVRSLLATASLREQRIQMGLEKSRQYTWEKAAKVVSDAIFRAVHRKLPV